MPAVIGWDGSVGDQSATLFAERLYRSLADRADLAVAVGDARRALLRAQNPWVRADWHLARLWLGPAGGGPLVGGNRKRSLVPAGHGTKIFLDTKRQVPVAASEMFVGRRVELQRSLRALRSGDHAGVLLHGQGRLGKSSLAARIADRCPELAVAVVFGDYGALAILDAVATALHAVPAARQLIEAGLPQVRQRPEAIEAVLTDLLAGPCAQAGPGGLPLLLIIDDLERILIADPAGPHRVAPQLAAVLAGVLRAFSLTETDSRLLVTSRYTFTLGGLEDRLAAVQLPPLSTVARVKLLRRQQALTPTERVAERSGLAGRAVTVSRGNPGLQDLIGLRLVYGEQVAAERAEAAVAGMEEYLRRGDLPADAEVRAFLEDLALDALLEEAGPSNVALLRAATLFTLPVPEAVIEVLADRTGGAVAMLRGLGLLDPYQDLRDPARLALAADPLTAGRIEPLDAGEQASFAEASIGPLVAAWGGTAPQPARGRILDLLLTRLALLADDPAITAACGSGAVTALRDGTAAVAFRFGQDAIELLDRHGRSVPVSLLRHSADAALTSGDGQAGKELLERAARQAEAEGEEGTDALSQAIVIAEQARHLITRGELDEATQLLQRACQMFAAQGAEREAAIAMGSIADIATQRGDYDEALRIHRDIELPVYERLGDIRSAAITWGQIADISYRRGDYDEALRIHRDITLPSFERLGDTREAAFTWGKIADITYQRGDYDEALRISRDIQLPVYERLGDTREAANTWGKIADISYRRGDYDEALRIHRDIQLPVYERLGDTREAANTWGKIANITYQRGDYDEAAKLQRRRLETNRQLGDLDGVAAACWDLAQIDFARQDFESAVPRLIESFEIFGRLQRPDGIALAGFELGRLMMASAQIDQAREVLGKSLAAAIKLSWTEKAQQISELLDRDGD